MDTCGKYVSTKHILFCYFLFNLYKYGKSVIFNLIERVTAQTYLFIDVERDIISTRFVQIVLDVGSV